jgi:fumarylacetoacetase
LLDASSTKDTYDISLQVSLKPGNAETATVICKSNLKYMYWSFKQQLAHHTINGCNMRTGDLLGTGTISGPTDDSFGSMLELSWNGSRALTLADGSSRKFIEDGDQITITGTCSSSETGSRLGFGACEGVLLPPSFSSMKLKQ